MSDRASDTERPYRTDEQWSRAVFARRAGEVAAFLKPHLRAGMRLIGCGPGSITADLAVTVAPGTTVGIDLRAEAVIAARKLARERTITTLGG